MSWETVKLGELLSESRTPCDNPNPDRRIKVKLKVLGVEKRGLESEIEGATKQFIRKAGQFIYGKQNFHKGAFGIIPQELDGFESSADLPAFDVSQNCLPEWIFYFFKQGNYYLELSKKARGVATQRIHPEQIYDLEIPLPDLDTQKKVIRNIKSLESNGSLINGELTQQKELLKKLRQAFLKEAMQGKLVKHDSKEGNAKDLLEKIKQEKVKLVAEKKLKKENPLPPIKEEEIPFEIPKNWVWCRGEFVAAYIDPQPSHRTPPVSSDGVPYISMGDISETGSIDFSRARKVGNVILEEHRLRYVLQEGDFVFGKIGTIGKPVQLPSPFNYTLSANLILIQPIRKIINDRYLFYFLSSPIAEKELRDKKSTTSYPVFGMGKARNMLIPLPPLPEQSRIVRKLEQLFLFCDELQQSIEQSQEANEKLLRQILKEALLPEEVTI